MGEDREHDGGCVPETDVSTGAGSRTGTNGAGRREPYAPTTISPPMRDTTSHEAHQASHRRIQLPLQHLERFRREVAEFSRHTNETFGFRRRSQCDPEVSAEQGGSPQRIAFHDVRLDGDGGAAELVVDRPLISRSAGGDPEGGQNDRVSVLPGIQRLVFVHVRGYPGHITGGSTATE